VLAGFILAVKNNRPYALWTHGVLAPLNRTVSVRKKAIYDRIVARRILDGASVHVFTAAGEREEVASLRLTTPSVVIPLGIDAAAYRELPSRGWFRDRYLGGHAGPLVLFFGRVTPKKGLDILAGALKLLAEDVPDVRLAIVGGGDPPGFENQVKTWLRQRGVEHRAVLAGQLTGSAKLSALADADVFVLPSHEENFATAMFESMASGLPVVVSDSLNLASEVKRYEAGLVVPLQAAEFARAMAVLIHDGTLRRRMADNGLRLVQDYSWEKCGERLDRTIRCLLRGAPLPADLNPK
jgi:glycosyltransferase involved in cell wall biosynthesis